MKKTILTAILLIAFGGTTFAGGPWNCSVDGYVGPDGTSCVYKQDGCYFQVSHHSIFFGLIKWNTEKLITCDKTTSLSQDTSIQSGG